MTEEFDHAKALVAQWREIPEEPSMTMPPGVPNITDMMEGTAGPMPDVPVPVAQEFARRLHEALMERGRSLKGALRDSAERAAFLDLMDNTIGYATMNLPPEVTLAFVRDLCQQREVPGPNLQSPGWSAFCDTYKGLIVRPLPGPQGG